MLPGGNFHTGLREDVRGFRKKNRPGRFIQQYAPFLVALQLVILVVTVLVLRSSNGHARAQTAKWKENSDRVQNEKLNLLTSLQHERQSRTTAENSLRDANLKLTNSEREVGELKSSSMQRDHHCNSVQLSFDRTRLALEKERDNAIADLTAANHRIAYLQDSLSAKDRELGDTAERHLAEHHAKAAEFASKEREWEEIRAKLTARIKSQGGWVPRDPPPNDAQHPDYAARSGAGVFHPSHDGLKERYIDTAEELEREGVVDPEGRSHLAQLLGHLYDLKVAEVHAMEPSHPGGPPPPAPAVGHWMAQTLESLGITCRYGTVHMAYVLDRHFTLDWAMHGGMLGRAAVSEHPGEQGGDAAKASQALAAEGTAANHATPSGQQVSAGQAAEQPFATPGVLEGGQHESERQRLQGWRKRQGQKVDAAGFI